MLFPLFDRNPRARFPWVTLLLILVNVGVFFYANGQGPDAATNLVYQWGFVPQRLSRIGEQQPIVVDRVLKNDQGEELHVTAELSTKPELVYATLITMMFLHGGFLHIISNMWMLWVFGDNIEDRLGRFVFLCFYLLGGIVGTLAQWAINPMSTQPVIGASGAVAAVLGAYLLTYPKAKVRTLIFIGIPLLFDLPAFFVLGAWFVMQVFAGVQGIMMMPANLDVSVAFWAHIGGFVAGVVLMPLLTIGAEPPDENWRQESQALFTAE